MISRIKTGFRLVYILKVLVTHRLDRVLPTLFENTNHKNFFTEPKINKLSDQQLGERLRQALETLGPIFVKFGQLLSTRSDFLPEAFIKELAKLQDKVPPFDGLQAQQVIEAAFGKPIEALFLEFDLTPLASASIAQVHAATTLDKQNVVVKVLRPEIQKTIQSDLRLLRTLARLLEHYSKQARRFKVKAMVDEFQKCLLDELDLMREAANASQLRRNFAGSPTFYVPEIHWALSNRHVLTMERLYGNSVADIDHLREQGVCFKTLAESLVNVFFTQVFRDCFFHADMHPGNLLVATHNPKQPQYLAVDFGIIGTLTRSDQRYLAENFLAFFKRDYRRVAELHVESGWVPNHIRADEFESAIRIVTEPIFERPLKDISFGKTLLRLLRTAERFEMNIQPQFLLLQKTLLNVEGLSRQLYPELDLWHTAKPFLEQWMKDQVGPRSIYRKWREFGPYWIERLPEIPNLLLRLLDQEVVLKTKGALAGQPLRSARTGSAAYHAAFTHTHPATPMPVNSSGFWKGFVIGLLVLGVGIIALSWVGFP